MTELTQEEQRQVDRLYDRREEVKVSIEHITSLMEHPGWKHLSDFMNAQLKALRVSSFETELTSIEGVLKAVSERGHMSAAQLHINLPHLILDDLHASLATIEADLDEITGKEDDDGIE